MEDRRTAPRICVDQTARIAVDEHHSLDCIVFDRSAIGVRVTLPDAEPVPESFVVTIDGTDEVLVCKVAWRRDDEIGARLIVSDAVRSRTSLLRRPIVA